MYCRYCNMKGSFGAKRCNRCGRPLVPGNGPNNSDDNSTAKIVIIGILTAVILGVLLVVLLISAGVGRNTSGRGGRNTTPASTVQRETSPKETVPKATAPKETQPEPTETEPPETEPSTPANTEPEYKVISEFTIYSFKELKDKLAPEGLMEPIDATFTYLGNEGPFDYSDVCGILSARAGGIQNLGNGKYRITALPYAGARILNAHRSKDTSKLTEDERKTLKKAEEIVDMARKTADSDWELELILHDWMCENISYYDVDFTIEFTEKRPLNAIGALLDGKANCQGYTDCFYLLGNMAGFVVDKQSDPHVTVHAFNTIKQGGQWYIVDVTHDDMDQEKNGEMIRCYQYLNAGMADCDERTWKPYTERNPVAQHSGSYYYYDDSLYLGEEHDYQRTYYSLYDAGRGMIAAYADGQKFVNVVVRGTTSDSDQLFNVMNQEASRLGITYDCTAWHRQIQGNTFYTVCFK